MKGKKHRYPKAANIATLDDTGKGRKQYPKVLKTNSVISHKVAHRVFSP